MYTCSECGRAVVVVPDGTIIRACKHTEAPVHAALTAKLYGLSALRNMTPEQRAERGV